MTSQREAVLTPQDLGELLDMQGHDAVVALRYYLPKRLYELLDNEVPFEDLRDYYRGLRGAGTYRRKKMVAVSWRYAALLDIHPTDLPSLANTLAEDYKLEQHPELLTLAFSERGLAPGFWSGAVLGMFSPWGMSVALEGLLVQDLFTTVPSHFLMDLWSQFLSLHDSPSRRRWAAQVAVAHGPRLLEMLETAGPNMTRSFLTRWPEPALLAYLGDADAAVEVLL